MTMMMMMKSMIATAVVLALSAVPCEGSIRRLYRVQPTQKVMPVAASSPSMNDADFERFDDDAKRALRELMVFPERHLSLEVISSMEYLSLSFSPVISMSSPPTIVPADVSDLPDNGSTGGNVAAVNRAVGGAVGENNGTNDFNNKPATISVSVFLLIAAMAVTALVVRKYKRAVMMAGSSDDQSILSGSVVSNNIPIV